MNEIFNKVAQINKFFSFGSSKLEKSIKTEILLFRKKKKSKSFGQTREVFEHGQKALENTTFVYCFEIEVCFVHSNDGGVLLTDFYYHDAVSV